MTQPEVRLDIGYEPTEVESKEFDALHVDSRPNKSMPNLSNTDLS